MLTESGGSGATADPAGDPLLRAAIAAHVRSARGARLRAVAGRGAVGRGHRDRRGGPAVAGRRSAGGRRGSRRPRRSPGRSGCPGRRSCRSRPTRNGLQPDGLPDEAAVAVVSPTVHVPTGASMPLARRVRILSWAATAGAIVIEDARADDLVLRGAPPACLQGLDTDGRVIHLGGFESLLHGGVRLAYAVVPPAFLEPFVAALDAIDPGPSPVQQRALGRFLADGLLDRHATRVRRALLDRQDATLEALERELGWLVEVRPAAGGTRLIATIVDPDWTAAVVVQAAADVGVAIDALGPSRHEPAPDRELVVDYGHHDPLELRAAIRALAKGLVAPAAGRRPAPRPTLPTLPTAAARA